MRKGYTMTYQMRKKQRQQREIIIQYALKFVGVVLLAFLIVRFVCFSFTIQGDSMSPSIKKGEKHLVNRLIYQIKGPSRYDVIVFKLLCKTSCWTSWRKSSDQEWTNLCKWKENKSIFQSKDFIRRTCIRRNYIKERTVLCRRR